MPDLRYRTCKSCGRSTEEVGPLSWTRLCEECGIARFIVNLMQLKAQRGPFAEYWAYRLAAGVGLAPLDGEPPRP